MKAVITVGISASGKTTWAHSWGQRFAQVISRDDIRWEMMLEKNLEPCWANWKWKWEGEVTKRAENLLNSAAHAKTDVIMADTNLNKGKRDALKRRLENLGFEVEVKVFHVHIDEALKRDAKRENGVGFWVLNDQWERYLAEFGEGRVTADPSLPSCIIVDIDGTAALMNGKRGPYDFDKVDLDDVNEVCLALVSGMHARGHKIIFLSGREGNSVCEELTKKWLMQHYAPYYEVLYMRADKDTRPDSIIKRELFDTHIRDKYHVVAVLDDRPRVARMWRDLGLNVVQFGNPYVDF